MESLLPLESWNELVARNPVLKEIQPDVQALLANRVDGAREYFIVPIDVCYELVGVIRTHWRGLSGGEEVWRQTRQFFERLMEEARLPMEYNDNARPAVQDRRNPDSESTLDGGPPATGANDWGGSKPAASRRSGAEVKHA
jgi:hypothetical protein